MKNSLLFLGFGLVAWAGLVNTWPVAVIILLAVLLARFGPWRWQITLNQFYRWGDLSSLLVVLLLGYLYLFQPGSRTVFILLKWLPALLAPVLLAQLFSSAQKLPLATLFYSLRRSQYKDNRELDFQPYYAAFCLLSAGAANVKNLSYFLLVVALFLGVFWTIRPKHGSIWAWLLIMVIAIPLSHFGQYNLRRLQNILEYQSVKWLGGWVSDPFKTQTSIGELGEMKLYDKIAFRVKAQEPMYLMQASYDRYMGKHWTVSNYAFTDDNPTKANPKDPIQTLEILQQFPRHEAMLALPDGTINITGMEGADLEYNVLGAVKITNAPDLGQYQVSYTGRRTGEPTENDLKVPKQHVHWLEHLSKQLKLDKMQSQSIIYKIPAYFQRNFHYSLYQGEEADADIALKNFILQTKAGHCEYFAVATVFLLRQAGIPARFANGYAVEEYDPNQDVFVVRYRHAHAWAIAYVNGFWQIVDSTPSQWLKMENENASLFQPLDDWFSRLLFNFKQWQIKQAEQQDEFLLWVAGIMTLYIGWRIYSARRQLTKQNKKPVEVKIAAVSYQGLDSAFYRIIQQLQTTDYAKSDNESVQEWVTRLKMPELNQLYKLHYQLRFDPVDVSPEYKLKLKELVDYWIKNNHIAIVNYK